MRLLLGLIALCVGQSIEAQAPFDFSSHIGIAVTPEWNLTCVSMPRASLSPGQRLILASPLDSAAVIVVEIRATGTSPCPEDHPSVTSPLYPVSVRGGVRPTPGTFWFAFLAPEGALRVASDVVSGDLDGDGIREFLRICTSMEGFHYSVWSGAPLTGRRRWTSYVPLHYDVEPSCDARDFADP